MHRLFLGLAIVGTLFLSGCANLSTNLKPGEAMPSDKDAIFVISNMSWGLGLTFAEGEYDAPSNTFNFTRDGIILKPYFVASKDEHYTAIRVPGGHSWALAGANTRLGSSQISWDRGSRSFNFTAPAGKVVYVGQFTVDTFKDDKRHVSWHMGDDFEETRQWMQVHYPALAPQLERTEVRPYIVHW